MAQLSKDLQLDETKFNNASRDMKVLKKRTNELKAKLEGMYESLASAWILLQEKKFSWKQKNIVKAS